MGSWPPVVTAAALFVGAAVCCIQGTAPCLEGSPKNRPPKMGHGMTRERPRDQNLSRPRFEPAIVLGLPRRVERHLLHTEHVDALEQGLRQVVSDAS